MACSPDLDHKSAPFVQVSTERGLTMVRNDEMMNEEMSSASGIPEEGDATGVGEEGGDSEVSSEDEVLQDDPNAFVQEAEADSTEGGPDTAHEAEALDEPSKSEAEVLQEELDRLRDQHLRLAADFENYRKRVSADLTMGWVRAQAELAKSLLEGLDDLQRVSQFTTEDATLETLIEGVDLVERKFLKALTDAGLQAVDPTGEPFDPNSMEAMMRVPVEEDGQDETVHQVFQKGYLFKDQLVRPARVSVYMDDD